MPTMDRYQIQNAAEKVDGYFLMISPTTYPHEEFARAQAECIGNMRRALVNVEALTFEEFCQGTGRKPTPALPPAARHS